ncbi:MAG: UDP-N-acetylmuramoyl-L-alanyl-D-glutamate--2,6-diaminopimelate ligase [Clostridia bacterium]
MNKTHFLKEYFELLLASNLVVKSNISDILKEEITNISYNSKEVNYNTMFICKGDGFKTSYLDEAIKNNALLYIADKEYENTSNSPYIIVSDIRKTLALISQFFYNTSFSDFKKIAVTGTKGKTTTTFLLNYIFKEALKGSKYNSGVISSLVLDDGKNIVESSLSTPESLELQKHLHACKKNNVKYLPIEVSSQAIKMSRIYGINFDFGVFLNISDDHYSPAEHKDFNDYFNTKLQLFSNCTRALICLDDENASEVFKASKNCKEIFSFSLNDTSADFYASQICKDKGLTKFKVNYLNNVYDFELNMIGLFNVSNALAAISIALLLNIPYNAIFDALRHASVPGRAEVFTNTSRNIHVIVDYAHNKLSFEKMYDTIHSEFSKSKIITVFGAPGGKALNRRKDLGIVASANSKEIYITEDDSNFETTENISNEILSFVDKKACKSFIISKRDLAIKSAINAAKDNDVIFIAGKGSDKTQKTKGKQVSYKGDSYFAKKYLNIQ